MTHVACDRLIEIVESFSRLEILVVGDVLLDTYLGCNALGIADEAPVPLLEITRESHSPGGAGNVALNLARLGVKTTLVGVVGEDREGEIAREALLEAGVAFEPLVVHRPTPHKTRVLSGSHYYLRFDEENPEPLAEPEIVALGRLVDESVESVAAVVVSDYAKGMISELLAGGIEISARRRNLPIYADLKPANVTCWRQLNLLTPNLSEARELLSPPGLGAAADDPRVLAAGLSRKFRCDVVLKLSADGMVGAMSAGESFHLEAQCQNPKNVSGAGDTVLSTLSAALACGATLQEAAVLANVAAAIAVSHEETHAVSAAGLRARVRGGFEGGA